VLLSRYDHMVHTGSDIRHLIECWLSLWKEGSFNVLLQEVDRCDYALCRSHGAFKSRLTVVSREAKKG